MLKGLWTCCAWDVSQAWHNRFLQVFAVACVLGGTALLAAAPGRETLPVLLIQAVIFFGTLFAALIGWASGQRERDQGAMLFAQSVNPLALLLGKWLGTGLWCLLLLALVLLPATLQAGIPGTMFALGALALVLLLVFLLAGLVFGLLAAPISGLLAVLLVWAFSVAGWELILLMLSRWSWMHQQPGLFIGLLLANPVGAFRVGSMIGIDTIPFNAEELTTGRWLFANILLVVPLIFATWLVLLAAIGRRLLWRREW